MNNKNKTIVILSHVTFDNSPYCSYVHSHAKELAKQGYHVVVFAIIRWLPILSNIQKYKKEFINRIGVKNKMKTIDGVDVIYKKAWSFSNFLYNSPFNINGFFYYRGIKKIFQKLNTNEEIEYIDAHTFKEEGYAAYKLKKKHPNIFTTVTLHGTSFSRNTTTKNGIKQIRKVFNIVDYAICVSDKLQKKLKKLGIENSKVIYNGINHYELENVDKSKYQYNIISVGALNSDKKHDLVIKSISKLKSNYPEIHLNIVGVGRQRDALDKLVNELGLKKYVTFKGRMENKELNELMNKSFIFILPSINEGFGIVYPEAMNNGCITIGTKGEGIDGFIKDKYNGFLVDPNVDEIVLLIDNIYCKKYEIETIIQNGKKDAYNLTWENNARQYIELTN